MLEARIQQQLFETADLINQFAEPLALGATQAAQALVATVTAGNKVLVLGLGTARLEAERLAAGLLGGHLRERPGLATVLLRRDLVARPQTLAAQVRALGQSGDALVMLAHDAGEATELAAIIAAAHERDMTVLAFTAGTQAPEIDWPETDVPLHWTSPRRDHAQLLLLLLTQALLDAVDGQLLGESAA